MFGLSQTGGYVVVGLVAAIIPLLSGFLALRANRETTKLTVAQQATSDLIDDLVEDREAVRGEVRALRSEVVALRDSLDECETERTKLTDRVAELERAS